MSPGLMVSVGVAGVGVILLVMSSRGGHYFAVAEALLKDAENSGSVIPDGDPAQRDERLYQSTRRRAWIIGGVVGILLGVVISGVSPIIVVTHALVGALGGELFASRRREYRQKLLLRRLEFHLPSVMERIVMGVGTGLDIIPALREASRNSDDPVSELLSRVVDLSEHGTAVDAAFDIVSKQTSSISVKHAFVHLGLAHRQGGEIVRPLKELSDATQLAYQEGVEEMIAKLPVKAVVPLVVTFAGLMLFFLTVPLMQVGSILNKVAHETKE